MSFKADPSSLDTFATVLEGLSDDVASAKDYLHKHLSYDYGDARMFANIANANNDTKSAVSGSLDRLADVVAKSSQELRKSAQMYRGTDDNEERRLDATYSTK
ncbi:type VII secretion target [Lentzea rhizosphaerae]|uniref:Type VII secretion target n=1 Tax=Lentzea rhizosphaerae TaxID=2041025 RepID=A0ABV8BQ25_9PSEU